MPRVIRFEGREISVPDDATDDEVAGILGGAHAAPAASAAVAAPAAAPSLTDTIMRGASPEDASGAVSSIRGAAESLPRLADRAGRGLAKGFISIGTLPVEAGALGNQLTEWLGGKAGISPNTIKVIQGANPIAALGRLQPVAGKKAVEGYLDTANEATAAALGVNAPPREGETMPERMVERGFEELGAATVPVAAAVNKARAVGVEGARQLPMLARMFVEPAAINSGKFVGKEATIATMAGTGAGAANEATRAFGFKDGDWQHALGDVGGALTGAGMAGAANIVRRPMTDILNAIFRHDRFSNEVVKNEVVDRLANTASTLPRKEGEAINTDPLVEAINRPSQVQEVIPGFRESLADRTGDPGIAAMEYGRQSGQNAGEYIAQRSANTNAIDDAMRASEPSGTPGALRAELALERERRLTDAAVQRQNAQDDLAPVLQRLTPTMTGEGRGANIRAALEGASENVRQWVREAWAPLNETGAQVDVAPLADNFQTLNRGLSMAERERFVPPEAGIPNRLAPLDEAAEQGAEAIRPASPQPINEVTGLRSALTDAQREALSNGRDNEARIIGQHLDALDAYLDDAIPADLRAQYDEARGRTRNFADRFQRPQTAIAQTLDRREGMYRQPDNAVTGKFVQADEGNVADFRALMQEAGDDQRVVTAVRDQMLSDIRTRGLVDDPAQLDAYVQRYNTVLSDPRFAGLRQELGNTARLRRAVDEAAGNEQRLTRELGTPERPGTSTVGQYLRYGDERAQDALKGVINSKNPGQAADELLRFVNDDPAAVEGGRKAFWDLMQTRARSAGETTKTTDGVQPWMPRRLKAFLDDEAVSAVAERLYRDDPEHLANVRRIAEVLQDVDVRTRAKAANTSGTTQGVSQVLTPETLQSRFYAYKRGQTSLGFMLTALGSVAARRLTRGAQADAIERLTDKALLDPKFAAELLKENNPANRAAMARTAKTYLGNEIATILSQANEDDEDPVKKAVMR